VPQPAAASEINESPATAEMIFLLIVVLTTVMAHLLRSYWQPLCHRMDLGLVRLSDGFGSASIRTSDLREEPTRAAT
jgi:hypothetical protein